jgi:hypothetical protein
MDHRAGLDVVAKRKVNVQINNFLLANIYAVETFLNQSTKYGPIVMQPKILVTSINHFDAFRMKSLLLGCCVDPAQTSVCLIQGAPAQLTTAYAAVQVTSVSLLCYFTNSSR